MVRLSKIYTKTGDSGETGLGDNSRISKASLRVAAIGAVDETNAAIGIARLDAEGDCDAMLGRIQNDLFDLGADLCVPEDGRKAEGRLRIVGAQVERLEREIDAMNEALEPLTSFVLPRRHRAGGAIASGAHHCPARGDRHGGAGAAGKNQSVGATLHQSPLGSSLCDGAHGQQGRHGRCALGAGGE
jgi:cob(I)alamin adenosyltransferase